MIAGRSGSQDSELRLLLFVCVPQVCLGLVSSDQFCRVCCSLDWPVCELFGNLTWRSLKLYFLSCRVSIFVHTLCQKTGAYVAGSSVGVEELSMNSGWGFASEGKIGKVRSVRLSIRRSRGFGIFGDL